MRRGMPKHQKKPTIRVKSMNKKLEFKSELFGLF